MTMGRTARGIANITGTLLLLAATAATSAAQQSQRLRVLGDSTAPVPFAVVSVNGATERVADASGVVNVALPAEGKVELRVRRVGYREFRGAPSTDSAGAYVRLTPLAMQLDAVVTTARESTPLARTGFYDRLERVQKGAIVGEFITPEQLDDRAASQTSDYFNGRRYARVDRMGAARRTAVIRGRAGCAMTVLVDGMRTPLAGEGTSTDAPTSINGSGSLGVGGGSSLDIDAAVNGRAIMAIEIYPSTANAPAELQTLGGRGSCGTVAIWTGPRR